MNEYSEIDRRIETFKQNIINDLVVDYNKIIVGLDIVKTINLLLSLNEIKEKDYKTYELYLKEYLNNNSHIIFDRSIMLGINHALAIVCAIAFNKNKILIKK